MKPKQYCYNCKHFECKVRENGIFCRCKRDNPRCINPEHLFVGTRQDNIDDRERKGRNVVKVGEEQPISKLTKKDVKNARWERTFKGTTYQALADKYGVNKHTIMNAIKGKTWKCVSYMPQPPKSGSSEFPNNCEKGGEA